jgi:hypothetical protein
MKTILFLLLLIFANPLFAQKDSVKTTVSEDKFNGTKSVNTEIWQDFGKGTSRNLLSGMIQKQDKTDVIFFKIFFTGNLGCLVQNSSTLSVKLSNDEIIEFTQLSNTDCSNTPTPVFVPLKESELNLPEEIYNQIARDNIEQLKKYEWSIIRLSGSEYYSNIEPNPTRRINNPEQFFIKHLEAIENHEIFKTKVE